MNIKSLITLLFAVIISLLFWSPWMTSDDLWVSRYFDTLPENCKIEIHWAPFGRILNRCPQESADNPFLSESQKKTDFYVSWFTAAVLMLK